MIGRFAAAANADELRATMNEMSAPDFQMPTRNVAVLAAMRFVPGQRAKMLEIVQLIAKDGKQGEIPRDKIAGLAMPVSVVWGTADPVLPFSHSRDLPAGFALHVIEGAGHMLPVEALKAVTAIIRRTANMPAAKP